MCFSAGASFGASAVVAIAGVISTRLIKSKEQFMFAAIPLIFALQQFIEGWVWLTFTKIEYRPWQAVPGFIFLFFAQVVWPIWVPLSIMKIEQQPARKNALRVLVYGSFIVAPLQAYRLIYLPWTVQMTDHHIQYGLDFSIPYFGMLLNMMYFMTTIAPPLLSSRRSVLVLGALNLGSFVSTVILFERNVISVWCFFAALISWQVVRVIKDVTRAPTLAVNS